MTKILAYVLLTAALLFSGCNDSRRIESLEKRVSALEHQAGKFEEDSEKLKAQQQARAALWSVCRDGAYGKYNSALKSNGTKQKDGSLALRSSRSS